jgi:hypothetical protein
MISVKHITVRNENLFCSHCGTSEKVPYPIVIPKFTAMIDEFANKHEDCEPVWKQPEPDMSQSLVERARWWMVNGERGISSETIYSVLCEEPLLPLRKPNSYDHPHDPDDFRRCYLLLKAIPEWREQLHKMKSISQTWSNLVDNWDKLTFMLEELIPTNKDNGMYDFMKSLIIKQK